MSDVIILQTVCSESAKPCDRPVCWRDGCLWGGRMLVQCRACDGFNQSKTGDCVDCREERERACAA